MKRIALILFLLASYAHNASAALKGEPKKRAIPLLFLLAVAAYGAPVFAQGYNTKYEHQTTSVNSGTVPVNVLPPAFMTTWCITADASCTKGLPIFSYSVTLPGSAPTNTDFIAPGATRCDAGAVRYLKTDLIHWLTSHRVTEEAEASLGTRVSG
jgi:hypothetical protein